jgi:HSP20 family molecular chaperone IbpA
MAGFLSKLTGSDNLENFNEEENFESNIDYGMEDMLDSSDQISLSIDAYQDEDNLYIRAFIPSVDPKEIDIDISRDTVTISGERIDTTKKDSEDFFQKELS